MLAFRKKIDDGFFPHDFPILFSLWQAFTVREGKIHPFFIGRWTIFMGYVLPKGSIFPWVSHHFPRQEAHAAGARWWPYGVFPKNGGSPKMDVVFLVENSIKMDDN